MTGPQYSPRCMTDGCAMFAIGYGRCVRHVGEFLATAVPATGTKRSETASVQEAAPQVTLTDTASGGGRCG
jgi:hypothetical protein